MLGVSRGEVVGLCDQGELAYVGVGDDRRVSRSEAARLAGCGLRREEEKSLWLHLAVVEPLLTDRDVVLDRARDNLRRWVAVHRSDGMAAQYFTRWTEILNEGLDSVVAVLTSGSVEACELRQNSPFAGVLDEQTRREVLRSYAEHRSRAHAEDAPSPA